MSGPDTFNESRQPYSIVFSILSFDLLCQGKAYIIEKHMGNISEHFNNSDFACKCPVCRGAYRVHLGLIGALEMMGSHFCKKVQVVSGFWCDDFHEKQNKPKRSFHTKGKAAHIKIEGVSPQDLFKFAETIPELRGLVFYPGQDFIHVDTRQADEPIRVVKEGANYVLLTPEKRAKYGL